MNPGQPIRLGPVVRVAFACAPPLVAVTWLAIYRGGLGLSYDSVAYASTRRLLEAGQGLHFPHLWPPASAALLVLTGTGAGAVIANCVALVAYLAACYALARAVTGRTGLATAVAVWVGLSIATIQMYSMMWSEPVFYAAVTTALLALVRIHQGGTTRWFALLVVACNVAFLSRYAGATLIAFAALALTWSLWPRFHWRALARVVPTIAASSVAAVAVMITNVTAGDPAMGERWPSLTTPLQVARESAGTVVAFTFNLPYIAGSEWLGVLLLAGALMAVWHSGWSIRGPEMVLAAWVLVYSASIVYGELTTLLDPVDLRYMAAVQPAAAILVAPFMAKVIHPGPVLAAAGVWLMVATSAVWVTANASAVPSYETVKHTYSKLPTMVEKVPAGAAILSNKPQWIAAATGRDRLTGFPDAGPAVDGHPSWLPIVTTADAAPGDYVVWFGTGLDAAVNWVPIGTARGVQMFRVS